MNSTLANSKIRATWWVLLSLVLTALAPAKPQSNTNTKKTTSSNSSSSANSRAPAREPHPTCVTTQHPASNTAQIRHSQCSYMFTGRDEFGTMDLRTGVFTSLGNSGLLLSGLGAFGGDLYGGVHNGNTLYRVNPTNGSLTAVGKGTISYNDFGSTTSGLYALDGSLSLYSIDPTTGTATFIGSTGVSSQRFTALSAGGPMLYLAVDFGAGSILYSLSTTTGAATKIGPTGTSGIGGLVLENGTLYAGTDNYSNALGIYALNTTTGQGELVTKVARNTGQCASPQSNTHLEQCILKSSLTSGSVLSVALNGQTRGTSS